MAASMDEEALALARSGRPWEGAVKAVEAIRLREMAEEVERALTGKPEARTIRAMNVDTQGQPEAVKRGAARATRKHPAQELLYKAGLTISDLAGLLGEKRSRVSAWMAQGTSQRPVPATQADRMAKGIPTGRVDAQGRPVLLRIPRTTWARVGG